jgi:hypothetical protein
MVQKSFDIDIPQMDYLTWFFERKLLKCDDDDELFIVAEFPQNAITRGQAKDLAQRIGYSLREVEGIGADGPGEDVVAMFSSNQVRYLPSTLIVDHVSDRDDWSYLRWGSLQPHSF